MDQFSEEDTISLFLINAIKILTVTVMLVIITATDNIKTISKRGLHFMEQQTEGN